MNYARHIFYMQMEDMTHKMVFLCCLDKRFMSRPLYFYLNTDRNTNNSAISIYTNTDFAACHFIYILRFLHFQ